MLSLVYLVFGQLFLDRNQIMHPSRTATLVETTKYAKMHRIWHILIGFVFTM